jgi:hypothetical protein
MLSWQSGSFCLPESLATMMTYKADIDIRPGDRVLYTTALAGLAGGSCRAQERVVERVDEGADKVFFTDGTTYNHIENPGMKLIVLNDERPEVL